MRVGSLRWAIRLWMFWLAGGISASPAHAESFGAVVTHVSDGDTVWVRVDGRAGKPIKLRLAGVDAPESCQAGGAQATAALASKVTRQHVQINARATDIYQRRIVTMTVAGEDIGAWLVRQGHAWSNGYRHRAGPYAAEERAARAAGRGLFADPQPIAPWVFRKQHGPCALPRSLAVRQARAVIAASLTPA